MTAETITGTIKHIFSFFIPPIFNLLFIGLAIGESLGVGNNIPNMMTSAKEVISNYIDAIMSFSGVMFEWLKLKPEEAVKFNPSGTLQSVINDLSLALKYISITGIIVFIFIAYVVDVITLWISALTCNAMSFFNSHFLSRLPTDRSFQMQLPALFRPPNEPSRSEQYAQIVFGNSNADESLSREALWKVVRAWLSQSAKDSFWLKEHNEADENRLSQKRWVDYSRVYLLLSVFFGVYSLHKNSSIWIILSICLTLGAFIALRHAYMKSEAAVREVDFAEFFYYRTANELVATKNDEPRQGAPSFTVELE
jgi:hypothetical protein